MNGLVMETTKHCDYCNTTIEWDDVVMETRVVYPYDTLMQVTHRSCWVAMDVVTKTILKSTRDIFKDGVDKRFQMM